MKPRYTYPPTPPYAQLCSLGEMALRDGVPLAFDEKVRTWRFMTVDDINRCRELLDRVERLIKSLEPRGEG